MIDLMLQNARVPALGLQAARLAPLIPIFDGHLSRTFHQCAEPAQAQAAFEKFHLLFGLFDDVAG